MDDYVLAVIWLLFGWFGGLDVAAVIRLLSICLVQLIGYPCLLFGCYLVVAIDYMIMSLQLFGCYLVGAVGWISLQLSGCYPVGVVNWIITSLRVSGCYLVDAVDCMIMSLQLSGCCLVGAVGWISMQSSDC